MQVLHGLLLVCLWLHLTQAFTPRFVRAEAEAEAVPGDSLPLSPEELELLEEVEKVKEKVEEKVAEVEKSLPFSYSGIKKRETYVNKNFVDLYGGVSKKFIDLYGGGNGSQKRRIRVPRLVKIRRKARFPRRSYGGSYSPPKKRAKSKKASKKTYSAPSTYGPPKSPAKKTPFTAYGSSKSAKPSYEAPKPSYATPQPTYSSPKPSYSAPRPSYPSPKPAYHPPPKPSYPPPAPTYSSPPSYSPPKPYIPKPAYSAPPPSYSPAPSYSHEAPAEYEFHYDVSDSPSSYGGAPAAQFGAWEKRSGYSTQGSYTAKLPDGRTQIVTYTVADDDSGFVAEVRYEGEAVYPPEPSHSHPHAPPAYSQPSIYTGPYG